MSRAATVLLAGTTLLLQACPSAYQRTYNQETQRLEAQQRVQDEQAAAAHAEASRYAAVVYFAVGSAVVGTDGQRELRWFVGKMQPYPQAMILVQGFADTTGSEATNQGLSEERARAIAAYLSQQGIAPSRLVVQGYGTTSAAASNVTVKGRARNRRVEVTVK
jgi:outer membrane protein OmpA-like peptidoglycan-associated protein